MENVPSGNKINQDDFELNLSSAKTYKLTPGGADLGKFKKIVQNPRYLHYLTAFMGDTGIKISGTL